MRSLEQAPSRRTSVRHIAAVALGVVALTVLTGAPGIASAATNPRTASVISTAKHSKLGTILVADETVYALKPSATPCTATCLKVWPPVLLSQGLMTATAGAGVDTAKLGTVATADGALQVTYAGKPLYWFFKDKAPGQVKGNVTDKWGKWYTMTAVKSSSGSKAPSTTNAGTGGTAF